MLSLTFDGLEVQAAIDQDGALVFVCPFCENHSKIKREYYRRTENEVRTITEMSCGQHDCGAVFEIIHNAILLWEPRPMDHWQYLKHYYAPALYPVWKSHNSRDRKH
jgi:hypothetical protein